MLTLKAATLTIAILLVSLTVVLPRVGSARADSGGSFSWSFDNGNITGWAPVVGWNSETTQPEYAQSCQVVNGEYSLTTCEPLYRLDNFTDFAYEAQARVVQATAQPIWGINFRVNPASPTYANIVAITGDAYTLAQGYNFEIIGGTPYLYLCTETCRVLSTNSSYIEPYINHRLRVVASGSSIKGYVDDYSTVEANDSTFSKGLIGIFSIPNGCSSTGCASVTTNFDNVTVTPQNPPSCSMAPTGLVSWWPGDGNAKDIADNNDAVLMNGASLSTGEVDKAFTFDGINQYVQVGDPVNLKISPSITLDAWVKPAALPPLDDSGLSGIHSIITKWGQSAATDAYGIWLHNPDGNIRLVGGIGIPGVSDHGLRSGGVIPVGVWTHVAMTYNGTTGLNILYVNGVQVAQRIWSGGITISDLSVLIGKEDSYLPRFFNGSIDEVEVYSRALTPSEVQSIFNAKGAGKCKTQSVIHVTKFFTDAGFNPLPTDRFGNPRVNVALARGMVRSTSPGEILAWVNITNTGAPPLQSVKLNETLPVDWIVAPEWLPAKGGIHVFYANTTSLLTNLEITDPATITVNAGNPETVTLAVPSLNTTVMSHKLMSGQTILLSVKLDYRLAKTSQSASSYPRNYTNTASATAWTQSSYIGPEASAAGSAFLIAYAKVAGDVNGDLLVDGRDLAILGSSFLSRLGDSNWKIGADLNNDGTVNGIDLAIIGAYFGS